MPFYIHYNVSSFAMSGILALLSPRLCSCDFLCAFVYFLCPFLQVFIDMKSVRAGSLEDEFDFLAPRLVSLSWVF